MECRQRVGQTRAMLAYDISVWAPWFQAEIAAAAALLGLFVVAMSINLERIVNNAALPYRAAETLDILAVALVIVSIAVFPMPSAQALGICIAVVAGIGWLAVLGFQVQTRDKSRGEMTSLKRRIAESQLATLPAVIGGVSLWLHWGGGLYWVAAGMLLSFLVAIANAWVLLVEIRRRQ